MSSRGLLQRSFLRYRSSTRANDGSNRESSSVSARWDKVEDKRGLNNVIFRESYPRARFLVVVACPAAVSLISIR